MIKVTLSFPKRRLLFPMTVERVRTLPSSWLEVPPHFLFQLHRFLLEEEYAIALVKALEVLLELNKAEFLALEAAQIEALAASITAWYKIEFDHTPPMPSFLHRGQTYYLPDEGLINSPSIEFPLADGYYEEAIGEGGEEAILNLIATLCREANSNADEVTRRGDMRVPILSRYQAEDRAKRLKGLPNEVQSLVFCFFVGCKKLIHENYAELFDVANNGNDEDAQEPPTQSNSNFLGWWGAYMDIAESQVFGNLEQVYQTSFHTICLYLLKKKREADEYNEKMEALKKTSNTTTYE